MSLSRQQWTLLGIFALFIGPVILVMMMRSSWWQYQPASLKNNGLLVQPPVQLELEISPDSLGKWLILYRMSPPCGDKCIEDVTALRQIHRAAGRRGENLAIVLLSDSDFEPQLQQQLAGIYPEFDLLTDTSGDSLESLKTINQTMQSAQTGIAQASTYVLDPNLNVILVYAAGANPNDIHKDLKRLLKLSDQENR